MLLPTNLLPTAALVLAAGNSSRLGQPKQLLIYQGETLLHRAVRTALAAGCAPVIVVTGALDVVLRQAMADLPCQAVHSTDWAAGMGVSIRAGLACLAAGPAVLVMSCDQPLVKAEALQQLIHQQQASGAPAAAATYAGTFGIPAVFAPAAVADLRGLRPEQGAKPLLASYGPALILVPMPDAAFDVDTPAAYAALLARPDGGPA